MRNDVLTLLEMMLCLTAQIKKLSYKLAKRIQPQQPAVEKTKKTDA